MAEPRWISLCAGMDATATLAMTGRPPVVPWQGGKRAVADHVLEILGDWPTSFLMVDASSAVVLFWRLAFTGRLPEVAEVIRDAPLDGEALWHAWSAEAVPADDVERSARWIVLQKGNFSGKPVEFSASWDGLAGCEKQGDAAIAAGYGERFTAAGTDGRIDAVWGGLAGYARVSDAGTRKRFTERVFIKESAERVEAFEARGGEALRLDLSTSSPIFHAGDLVTIDPPYKCTSGYKSKLPRARVVELAEEADEAGARVLVHEAEPILSGGTWRHVELERSHGVNQRTWSKQKREVATINFEPRGQMRIRG